MRRGRPRPRFPVHPVTAVFTIPDSPLDPTPSPPDPVRSPTDAAPSPALPSDNPDPKPSMDLAPTTDSSEDGSCEEGKNPGFLISFQSSSSSPWWKNIQLRRVGNVSVCLFTARGTLLSIMVLSEGYPLSCSGPIWGGGVPLPLTEHRVHPLWEG